MSSLQMPSGTPQDEPMDMCNTTNSDDATSCLQSVDHERQTIPQGRRNSLKRKHADTTTYNNIGTGRKSSAKWLRGRLCPVPRATDTKPYFIKPIASLPDGYNDKDVYLHRSNLSSYLPSLATGDEVEFILGDRDKQKPMARKVRIFSYRSRECEDLEDYMSKYMEQLRSRERNQVLVETLPCLALWKLLGSATSRKKEKFARYIETLLKFLCEVLSIGKQYKTLVEDMILSVLQSSVFQENNSCNLADTIRNIASDDTSASLFDTVSIFSQEIARNVPKALRALLPSISELVKAKPELNLDFAFQLLYTVLTASESRGMNGLDVWSEMPLVPGTKELAGCLVEKDNHLTPVKLGESYNGAEEYMDTYFRLLRAETFAAIQRGIKDLKDNRLDPRDMNVYFSVILAGYEVYNGKFSLALHFKPAREVKKWEASPQLMFGNLICISPNRRFDDVIWATVSNRDTKLLASSTIITVDLIDYNSKSVTEIMTSLRENNGLTVMVESPTYYLSLSPVLRTLQDFDVEKFSLQEEIVHAICQEALPEYIANSASLDTSGISKEKDGQKSLLGSEMTIEDFCTCENSASTTLDESQLIALLHALQHKLAIIQGPPGCGKTYLGVKIVQLLLSLMPSLTEPILLLTYKNHALDEFLKAMFDFCAKDDIVRIGGRSKENQLEECNLNNIMKQNRAAKAVFVEIEETRQQIQKLSDDVSSKSVDIDSSYQLTRETLIDELSEEQLESLILDAAWNKRSGLAYRVNSRTFADSNWAREQLTTTKLFFESTKAFLKKCVSSGVPKRGNNSAQHCFGLFLHALKFWLPDRNELSKLKKLQSQFIPEVYDVKDHKTVNKVQEESDDDGDYDEEEVTAMLEARLGLIGRGDGKMRNRDNLVIFDSSRQPSSSNVLIQLSDYPTNMESSVNLPSIKNIWSLSEIERMQFLYSLLHERSTRILEEFDEMLKELEKLQNRKQELETQQKAEVLLCKKIIGVTITGASIHHNLLHQLGTRIVIVEEAAEILEPSLLAALPSTIEHLILIGDHQQLKPQVDTYTLTKQFGFNVSLMERLIKCNFPYKTLTKQNRMRPEFAVLLHDIYPALQDNLQRVESNIPLHCLSKSMFFWTHNHEEKKDRTFTNNEEANMVVALVLYLLSNGCKPSEITVLAAYLGQTKLLRQMIKKRKSEFPDLFEDPETPTEDFVQVQTIDMFQGDENKYVIVSLVRSNEEGNIGFLKNINRRCVAQSRAKCGMYFVGSRDTLTRKPTCWQPLIDAMDEKSCVGKCIQLQCWKHKESIRDAGGSDDVMETVTKPQTLCKRKCGDQLPCHIPDHTCERNCFPRHQHTTCSKWVDDVFPDCGHRVKRRCNERLCDLLCKEKVIAVLPECGHQIEKKCHQKTEDLQCPIKVDYTFPKCGHPSPKQKKCSEEISWKCCFVLYFDGKCGHSISRECHQKEAEVKCPVKPCGRKRDCGCPCTNMCGEDCNKGNCRSCKEKHEAKMKQFREAASERVEELKRKIKEEGTKKFFIEEIHRSGATAAEYQKVEDQVLKFVQPCHNWYPSVTKIEKVTNLEMEKKFEIAKTQAFGDYVDTKFHGTDDAGVLGITKDGFRMPDPNPPPDKRGMYGQGIYFATDSSKSAQGIYTKGSNKLLLCHVILGLSKEVKSADHTLNKKKLRREGYDSVFAPRGTAVKNDEFVIFDPDQALPRYIIHYNTTGYTAAKPASLLLPPGQTFVKKNVSESRTVDPNDPFENYYRLAACHYYSHRTSTTKRIQSIDVVINQVLESRFEAKKKEFKSKGIPDGEVLAYHGTNSQNIDSILLTNLDVKYAKRQAYGKGNYFSEFPEISMDYGDGLLLCRVLPGKEWVGSSSGIKPGYNSRKVCRTTASGIPGPNVSGEMVIIEESDQILPYFVFHLS